MVFKYQNANEKTNRYMAIKYNRMYISDIKRKKKQNKIHSIDNISKQKPFKDQ